jgi:hypothetical protein
LETSRLALIDEAAVTDGVGDLVVQALARIAEDQQQVDQRPEAADEWNERGHDGHGSAAEEQAHEAGTRAVSSHDAQPHDLLAQRAAERVQRPGLDRASDHVAGKHGHEHPAHHREDVGRGARIDVRREEDAAAEQQGHRPDHQHHQQAVEDDGYQPLSATGELQAVSHAAGLGKLSLGRGEAIAVGDVGHGVLDAKREVAWRRAWRSQ